MPSKEARKLVRVGDSSLAIILPRHWLRYYGLRHGDKMEITSSDIITIKPKKREER